MREGVMVVDDTGAVRYANPSASRLLATPAGALVGQPVPVSVPEHGSATVALPTGTAVALRVAAIPWHGRTARLLTMHEAAGAEHGEPPGVPGDMARAREQRDQLCRVMVAHLPDGDISLFDHDLRVIVAAGTLMARFGLDPASLEGKTLGEGLGAEVARIFEPHYVRALAGEDVTFELDGGAHVFRIRVMPIRDARGEIWAGMAMSQEITEIKRIDDDVRRLNGQLETLLRREQEARADAETQRALLEGVVDQAPAMMCVHEGPDHVFLYVNEIYCKVVGRSQESLVGRPAREVLPEIESAGIFELLDRVYRTGESFRASEMRVPIDVNQDGVLQDMYFTFTYQPTRDPAGQVNGLLVHAIDVTESVRARQALEQKGDEIARLNRELERRVAERTAELTAANQELEAFAYSVSHDLRAPLRRIDGYGRALLEDLRDRLDDNAWHYLSRIRASTQHMGEIIDDLLSLARVARQELQMDEVSLSELAHGIVRELREQAPERRVAVHIAPAMTVRGDARLLRLVLENLLANAWKFTSKRDQAVVEVGQVAPGAEGSAPGPAGAGIFFVRDNGAGFDPAFTAKLFTTFNRLHSPIEFPGTGIGLATVKRVLDRHGGSIWAEGAVDRGAVFYFALPGTLA